MILDKQLLVGYSMGKETHHYSFQFNNRVIIYPILFVLLMWLVFWFELRFNFNFTKYGVLPRELSGLRGILFSPLIHSNLSHLWHNSIPTLVLLAGLIYFYRPVALKVFLFLIIFSGLGTWTVGREAYHIGASGIVYGLASFLFFKGLWSKNFRLTAFSLIVVFLYGSLIWGTLPLQDSMSWEGHLSGFLTGAILALLLRNKIAKAPKYLWETESYNSDNDPFLQQFDENGNFIDPPAPDTEDENFKED